MIWRAALIFAFLVLAPSAHPQNLKTSVDTLAVPDGIAAIEIAPTDTGPVAVLIDGKGIRFRIVRDQTGKLALQSNVPPSPPIRREPNMLPDGIVVPGFDKIAAAWLVDPTRRYNHGVLGDAIEASGLRVRTAAKTATGFDLGPESVFEDRFPRLGDMDGDGQDDILLVRSYVERGAALAVYRLTARGTLELAAEAEPIGRPNRWLNPIGVADFDGDNRPEAAVVRTPHIGGTLMLYELQGSRLEVDHTASGFSNHAIGSRELGMSAIVDADGDQIADLAVPDATRKALRIVTFAGGTFKRLAKIELDAEIATAIVEAELDGDGWIDLVFGLKNGKIVAVELGE